MHESSSTLTSHSPPISYFPAICGAAHLWTLLNGAVVWPEQPSAALSFQSPCSAVRLPPESCQDFPLFLHGNTFPSTLANNSNILSHSTLGVSLLPPSFFTPSAVYSLAGYFHPRVACQSLVSSALGIICFVFDSI